ncbi:hypothetical protein ADL21_14080 [Streptomyces albus subsp. albus]|nr:hypothetical protein ADL21_14080 [Streptomyces albus subsp. albus]
MPPTEPRPDPPTRHELLDGTRVPRLPQTLFHMRATRLLAQQTHLAPQDVTLAVEIVSEDTADRDREAKPRMYAAHGVRHFWRVEEGSEGLPVVYVHELDPATRAYVLTGIHHNRLKLAEPFAIDIDLTAIDRRR